MWWGHEIHRIERTWLNNFNYETKSFFIILTQGLLQNQCSFFVQNSCNCNETHGKRRETVFICCADSSMCSCSFLLIFFRSKILVTRFDFICLGKSWVFSPSYMLSSHITHISILNYNLRTHFDSFCLHFEP